ncbi:Hpt domain-containing protein [Spongiibacter marinus]|uniref:Hpt domain-containing protein n=1 Tax=Spongiibacter marinus TaxID=354246 RepID=UPI0003F73047|nr:Hpt domain-containing protein [Spongiibacter marinus]
MDANEHEGILAIFLAEAEDIVKGLFAQLEELQYGYDGQRILDDIHRGFHTLYGGAAVLELVELTECARLSERVMDRLRTRRIALSPSLVSLIVGATSAIEVMLSRLINHQTVNRIPDELRGRLLKAAGQAIDESKAKLEGSAPRSGDALLDVFFDAAAGGRSSAVNARPAATSGRALQSDAKLNTLLDSLYSPATSVVDKKLKSAPAAARVSEPQISDLVSELAWVRNRLMGFRAESEGDKLNKALAYLDLVTQDMERWLQRHQSGGQ